MRTKTLTVALALCAAALSQTTIRVTSVPLVGKVTVGVSPDGTAVYAWSTGTQLHAVGIGPVSYATSVTVPGAYEVGVEGLSLDGYFDWVLGTTRYSASDSSQALRVKLGDAVSSHEFTQGVGQIAHSLQAVVSPPPGTGQALRYYGKRHDFVSGYPIVISVPSGVDPYDLAACQASRRPSGGDTVDHLFVGNGSDSTVLKAGWSTVVGMPGRRAYWSRETAQGDVGYVVPISGVNDWEDTRVTHMQSDGTSDNVAAGWHRSVPFGTVSGLILQGDLAQPTRTLVSSTQSDVLFDGVTSGSDGSWAVGSLDGYPLAYDIDAQVAWVYSEAGVCAAVRHTTDGLVFAVIAGDTLVRERGYLSQCWSQVPVSVVVVPGGPISGVVPMSATLPAFSSQTLQLGETFMPSQDFYQCGQPMAVQEVSLRAGCPRGRTYLLDGREATVDRPGLYLVERCGDIALEFVEAAR